jgi:hypothetical protein
MFPRFALTTASLCRLLLQRETKKQRLQPLLLQHAGGFFSQPKRPTIMLEG